MRCHVLTDNSHISICQLIFQSLLRSLSTAYLFQEVAEVSPPLPVFPSSSLTSDLLEDEGHRPGRWRVTCPTGGCHWFLPNPFLKESWFSQEAAQPACFPESGRRF